MARPTEPGIPKEPTSSPQEPATKTEELIPEVKRPEPQPGNRTWRKHSFFRHFK